MCTSYVIIVVLNLYIYICIHIFSYNICISTMLFIMFHVCYGEWSHFGQCQEMRDADVTPSTPQQPGEQSKLGKEFGIPLPIGSMGLAYRPC